MADSPENRWLLTSPDSIEELRRLILACHADTKLLTTYVIGNGTPGLVRQVAGHEKRLAEYDSLVALSKWAIPIAISLGPVFGVLLVKIMGA